MMLTFSTTFAWCLLKERKFMFLNLVSKFQRVSRGNIQYALRHFRKLNLFLLVTAMGLLNIYSLTTFIFYERCYHFAKVLKFLRAKYLVWAMI